jgi:hypothetical protein
VGGLADRQVREDHRVSDPGAFLRAAGSVVIDSLRSTARMSGGDSAYG